MPGLQASPFSADAVGCFPKYRQGLPDIFAIQMRSPASCRMRRFSRPLAQCADRMLSMNTGHLYEFVEYLFLVCAQSRAIASRYHLDQFSRSVARLLRFNG